ncbi:MAG TPA: class I SAM-dependent methyltransferase [Gemmatimonadaceae bacterium]|nr:class I SAM-dependent methyltransferase [Gemmatimonadaceae bacterium]
MTTYPLGYTDGEQARLIRQAQRLAPMTERCFLDAGIATGWRVLELGSGLGDVSLLLARLVGPSGEVVGIERDASSIARATARLAEAGVRNVRFRHADVRAIAEAPRFDAVVGRYILQWMSDPLSVLKNVVTLVRSGGVVAFQETAWTAMRAYGRRLPLINQVLDTIYETLSAQGVHMEMGFDLYRTFKDAGLPAPTMRLEMILGGDAAMATALADLARSVAPTATTLGDLDTLAERILGQVQGAQTVMALNTLVSAWAVRS